MNTVTPLTHLKEGQCAYVANLLSTGPMRRRLQDLGIVSGTSIECFKKSLSGDPIAYRVRGTIIALRNEDANNIIVTH